MSLRLLDISKDAEKFLLTLPPKQFRQINVKILSLRKNPMPNDYCQLSGFDPPRYRVDVGEYRIAYRFDDLIVYISVIKKRNDDEVYKALQRKTR